MKFKINYLAFCFLAAGCCGCVQESPQIKVVCERTNEELYSFKWEVLPPINGSVKIYASFDPNRFDLDQIPFEAKISDGLARFPVKDNAKRYFFLLKFNNRFEKVIAARFAYSDKIRNLHDLGGYVNKEDKTIKWGKVYRSGDIDVPKNERDRCVINQMGVKTIVDFCDEKEKAYPLDTTNIKNVNRITSLIPNPLSPEVIDMILGGKMRKGDILLYMQGRYLDMYENADVYFKPMFECLLNPDSYPVLITSERGVDRAGFGAALLMAAIDIPNEIVSEEYLLSKNQIDIRPYLPAGKQISFEQQEAISLLLNPQDKVISMIYSQMIHDYGSVDNYLEKKLQLDHDKRKKLKELLLY